MKIELHEQARSALAEFAEKHGLTISINERNPRVLGSRFAENSRYYAFFKGVEIKDGPILQKAHGNGSTPDDAMSDYAKQISNHRLVFGAYTQDRREIDAPILLHNLQLNGE